MSDFDFPSMMLGVLIGVGICLWIITRYGCAYRGCLMCNKD